MLSILEKIRSAKTPDRFTQDFLSTKLGFKGGSYKQFIPLAKKLGLLGSDGAPTDLYRKFRNTDSSKVAMAKALRTGYGEVFERNEYADRLDAAKFKGLVVEITGLESDSRVVQLICQTFTKLKTSANFDGDFPSNEQKPVSSEGTDNGAPEKGTPVDGSFPLGLSYTINLVLPKTDDPAVFNAIFVSLRDNLLRK
jgi:hypothetical protein